MMKAVPHDLIQGYFDDVLTAEQHAKLCEWIKSDPEHAKIFAMSSMLHDRLRDVLVAHQEAGYSVELPQPTTSIHWSRSLFSSTTAWNAVAGVAVLVLGIGLVWFSFGQSTASAAFRELDRIIVNNIRSKDRTYEIAVDNIVTPAPRGNRTATQESRRPAKPPLDHASLYVRDGNQFVLVRKTVDGLPFVTGSNGKQSWAVNTKGPVRVSSDVHHFDHDLPGHETSVPLTNLHEGLERLRKAYSVYSSPPGPEEFEDRNLESVSVLVAVKKPKERGPQRVEIAYESATGRILNMRFVQMPYGPDRLDLRLSLLSENELPQDFFEHISHHTPDRIVETEN